MNKEEDYRNLAGNITAFTDNTCYYEDWLVIQQYVDDWLDEIDRLNNIINDMDKQIDNLCNNQKREVDKLNNDIKTLLKENEAKEEVIKKQDNVINKLEKWLKEENSYNEYKDVTYRETMGYVLDKLKELKEEK